MDHYEVIVIGAGAAGVFAAAGAAERGRRVLLIEKNRKAAVKVLMSGGSRCNLTHDADAGEIADAFERLSGREQARFLRPALARLTPDALIARFEAEGVRTKIEPTGKVFPASDRALDVQRALLRILSESGAELSLGEAVREVRLDPTARLPLRFAVQTDRRTLAAESLVLAVGGQSYPGCGTTGDGYAWAKALGHRVVPPRPALVALTTDAAWVRRLQGVTLGDARLRLSDRAGVVAAQRRGSLLLTHFGLSGPPAMDASRHVTLRPEAGGWTAELDLLPAIGVAELDDRLRDAPGGRGLAGIVAQWLPRSAAEGVLALAGVGPDRRAAELTRGERRAVIENLKGARAPIHGTLGFKKAEVTAGGVDLAEVDPRTMRSRLVPGLYFCGELLDIDGPIGGYNFQAAFSTGSVAGDHA